MSTPTTPRKPSERIDTFVHEDVHYGAEVSVDDVSLLGNRKENTDDKLARLWRQVRAIKRYLDEQYEQKYGPRQCHSCGKEYFPINGHQCAGISIYPTEQHDQSKGDK